MPFPVVLLSLLGLIPYIGCGLAALGPHSGAADPWLLALIAYAALVLTFVGGMHWGLVLREPEPPLKGPRIGLAVLPLLLGWVALAAAATLANWVALVMLIFGYILAIAVEQRAGQMGMLPARYLALRWVFTVVAVAMLTTVVTLRLLGQTIVF